MVAETKACFQKKNASYLWRKLNLLTMIFISEQGQCQMTTADELNLTLVPSLVYKDKCPLSLGKTKFSLYIEYSPRGKNASCFWQKLSATLAAILYPFRGRIF